MSLAKVMAKEKNITVEAAEKMLKAEDEAFEQKKKAKAKVGGEAEAEKDDEGDGMGRPKLKPGKKYIKQRKVTKHVGAGTTAKLKAYLGI